jgi:hypothetical protein
MAYLNPSLPKDFIQFKASLLMNEAHDPIKKVI